MSKDVKKTTIVFMAGFAGAGKTELAIRLFKKLDWELLNKDFMKLKRLKEYSQEQLNNSQEINRAGYEAFNELFDAVEERVEQGRSLIVDSCGYPEFILEHIRGIMQKQPGEVQLKVILCRARKEKREQRLRQRGSEFVPYVNDLPEILPDELEEELFAPLQGEDMVKLDTDVDEKLEDNVQSALKHLHVQGFTWT